MRLIVVSGRSGSGKSTALHLLEDNGFYCIDNLPAGLLPELARQASLNDFSVPDVAISIDARNLPNDLARFPQLLKEVRAAGVQCDILFLAARDEVLIKRFSETRRKHPLTDDQLSLGEALAQELKILEPIIDLATLKVDTSHLNLYQLRDQLKQRLLGAQGSLGSALHLRLEGLTRAALSRRQGLLALGEQVLHERLIGRRGRLSQRAQPPAMELTLPF